MPLITRWLPPGLRLENRVVKAPCLCSPGRVGRFGSVWAGVVHPRRCSCGPGLDLDDCDQVVGEDPVAAPDGGAVASIDEAAVPAVAAFEVADASFAAGSPFDQVAEAGRVLDLLPCLAGLAFAGDDHGLDAEFFEFAVDRGLAVATVGGRLVGGTAEALADASDRRGRVARRRPGCRS